MSGDNDNEGVGAQTPVPVPVLNDSAAASFDAATFLKTLSSRPGVYRMLDAAGTVLYVGKARNLKRRVSSYFRPSGRLETKTMALMSHVASVEVTLTRTEGEALLLENNLIKEYRPRYNVVLRDDKSYPWIYVTTEHEFPRLAFHRGARRGKGRYFGPYPSAGAVRETLNLLQKLFQVRQCEESFFRNRSRPCLQHQIKRCTAPCVGLVDSARYAEDVRHAVMFLEGRSEQMITELVTRMEAASAKLDFEMAARYRDQIASLRRIQERQYVSGEKGNIDVVAVACGEGMAVVQVFYIRNGQSLGNKTLLPRHSANVDSVEVLAAFLPQYYLAQQSRAALPGEILVSEPVEDVELLQKVLGEHAGKRLAINWRVRGERARWLDMARSNAAMALAQRQADRGSTRARLEALQEALELDEVPQRIECFDVSHTRGEATVASCVVFDADGAVKSDYRRFNIRDVAAGDDYAAMHQALERRYARVQKEEGRLPDLLLIDGGRGQVKQAIEVLEELQLPDIRVVGIAKGTTRKPGLETLIPADGGPAIVLPSGSPALHLLQQIRDEAHRFAITGHRQRRAKSRGESPLEQIPGVGARLRQRLLTEFGGLQAVSRAGVEDLARVRGISTTLAQAIYDRFHEAE